jgi:hypothetical protein
MQDKLMGQNYNNESTLPQNAPPASSWSTKALKEARKKKIIKGLESYGPMAEDFQNQKEMFESRFFITPEDKKLVNYYKSLGFDDSNIMYHTSADVLHPVIKAVGSYHDGSAWSPVYKKPVQPVVYKKPEPKKEVKKPEPVKKEQSKPIERKQNIYEGSPVYSPGAGIGAGSALVGFTNQKGDTTYIKPEDYERFAVPKYGKAFIESKMKKQRNGGVNNADAQPIKKLDQLLNFTNYNKPTKGGWLDKYN